MAVLVLIIPSHLHRELNWEDVKMLAHVKAVIKEALRVMPPAAQGSLRKTNKMTRICGMNIPANCGVSHHVRFSCFYVALGSVAWWGSSPTSQGI